MDTVQSTECRKCTAVLLSIICKRCGRIMQDYSICDLRVTDISNHWQGRTCMTVQRQFVRKLNTGEDDQREFVLQFVINSILITSRTIRSCTFRCGCGYEIFNVFDHEPGKDNDYNYYYK